MSCKIFHPVINKFVDKLDQNNIKYHLKFHIDNSFDLICVSINNNISIHWCFDDKNIMYYWMYYNKIGDCSQSYCEDEIIRRLKLLVFE